MKLDIVWNKDNYLEFITYLKSIREEEYKKFHSGITPTKYEILGIRLPILRGIAKEIVKGDYQSFLKEAKHTYYEEVMVQGLVIAHIKDIEELMKYFYRYVDLIDNWALCDTFCNSLKIVNKRLDYFWDIILKLVYSEKEYNVRVGFILMLGYYVKEEYITDIFYYLDTIKSEEYYINMAKAWLLCEVFIKYQKEALEYLENNHLDKFTVNKAISKIRDSYRVSKEMKEYILKYKK